MVRVNTGARRRGKNATQREFVFPEQYNLPGWVHPEVLYHFEDWVLIRDAVEGERAVKDGLETYLPKPSAMTDKEYFDYLNRATYYNFTNRTCRALIGRLLRKPASMTEFPAKYEGDLKHISITGQPLKMFQKKIAREIVQMGRFGVLVDLPSDSTTTPKPYLAGYVAENILDWETAARPQAHLPGSPVREVLTKVVLREWKQRDKVMAPDRGQGFVNTSRSPKEYSGDEYYATYRVLELAENGDYTVRIFESDNETDAEMVDTDGRPRFTPTMRGKPLKHIPFYIFGSADGEFSVESSPLLDIARLNVSHFRSYANLEQGRHYTGFPVYYAEISGSESGGSYELGPNRVWELEKGSRAGIIEFNGSGLKFLENALNQKESQAASLGGRMVGIQSQAVAESDNMLKVKELNEQAMLLDIALQLDTGVTRLLQWWLAWSGATDAEVKKFEIEFSKDFLLEGAGAREFRAIHSMYKDGVIPIEVVYDYFRRFEVIPDTLELDKFVKLLESKASFPQQPDAEARLDGYPSRKDELAEDRADKEAAAEERRAKEAVAAAKAAAAAAPAPGQAAPGNPRNPRQGS